MNTHCDDGGFGEVQAGHALGECMDAAGVDWQLESPKVDLPPG